MTAPGHSLQIVARWKSVYVRNAPKAAAGGQDVARRDGPGADIRGATATARAEARQRKPLRAVRRHVPDGERQLSIS